ncbi:biopolymer transporter ExbD [bacterium]|nr:biopolymer transporter ExbD [bacterium]
MKRSRYTAISEINVTNLVDVTLVLLIIFMITAPLLRSGIEVKLPESEARDVQPKEGTTVTLREDGSIYINDSQVDPDQFEVRLLQQYQESGRKLVLLKGDERIPYGRVVTVMDMIKGAGISNLGLLVEPGRKQ